MFLASPGHRSVTTTMIYALPPESTAVILDSRLMQQRRAVYPGRA